MSDNTKTFSGRFPFPLKVRALETVIEPREISHEERPLRLSTEICLHEQQMVGSALHSGANSD